MRVAWAVDAMAAVGKTPPAAVVAEAAMADLACQRPILDAPSVGVQATVAVGCLIALSR